MNMDSSDGFNISTKIYLNIGGKKHTTTLGTLQSKQSMFSTMFSGRFELQPDDDGYYFIDRDGKYFRYILNFMRDGFIPSIRNLQVKEELYVEACYYQLEDLIKYLTTVGRPNSMSNRIIKDYFFPVGDIEDGIINWLSTKGYSSPWSNPVESGILRITASTCHSKPLFSQVSSVVSNHESTFYTSPSKGPPHYIDIILPDGVSITPTHYILGTRTGRSPLRNWNILGKVSANEYDDWVLVSEHIDDESIQNSQTCLFEINAEIHLSRFQCFRIESTGPQGGSQGHSHIGTSAFELFGFLYINDHNSDFLNGSHADIH